MPITHNSHQQAAPGSELRGFEYRKFADVAAMNLVTGRPGEICTVTATGVDYQWNQTLTAWVPWHNNGTVLRQDITGAATVNVAGRSAVEATLTGNVTGLTISGWSTDNTITQRVRFQLRQDATGGRTFAWADTSGVWVEAPPSDLDTDAGSLTLLFDAVTTNGGATVWLEPIGVTYRNSCRYVQVQSVPVPAVTANGTVVISHSFEMVVAVELIDIATGRRVLADWWQSGAVGSAAVNIDFQDAWPAGTYTVRVAGLAASPCQLTASVSEWDTWNVSLAAASTVTTTLIHSGTASQVQWVYGDGTPPVDVVSGAPLSHTYGSAFTGQAVIRYRRGVRITELSDGVSPWVFNIGEMPSTLLTLTVEGGGSAITGDLGMLPPNMTRLSVGGLNTITGSVASLPSTLTFFQVTGLNTTFGNVGLLPVGLTAYYNTGFNTTSGSVAALPAGLTVFGNTGNNTTSGSVAGLPVGLTYYENTGNNTTSGSVAGLPAGLTFYLNNGSNTTSGSVASLPVGLTQFTNGGLNTTTGDVGALPAGLTRFNDEGFNTTSGSVASLPATLTFFQVTGANTTSGDIGGLPAGLVTYFNTGNNTTSGSVAALPAGLTLFGNTGNNTTSGSIASLPAGLSYYENQGFNTTSGSIASLPAGLTAYVNDGANTTSGNIGALPAGLTAFSNRGANTCTLSTAYTPPGGLSQFWMLPAAGSGLSAASVDAILVAINALNTSNGGSISPDIDLRGVNATPTATGVTAANALSARGWTVLTN